MLVRTVGAHETALCSTLGDLVVRAYVALPGHVDEPDYEKELADVAGRAAAASTVVFAAIDDDGTPLGCATYVDSPASPMAEGLAGDEAGMRMLGVDPGAQGRGAGRALVSACVDAAVAARRSALCLHTTPWMTGAHRLYEAVGFARDPDRDWVPVPGIPLLGYRLDLSSSNHAR